MFEQGKGGHDGHDGRPAGVVKYDCLQCKHTPVHKAITSRAMATMMRLHVEDDFCLDDQLSNVFRYKYN